MALPNISGEIIAQGYNCQIYVGTNYSDAQPIALVASFQANEDFQIQEAVVIGNLGPVSLDPQGYTCSITMDGFLAYKEKGKLNGDQQYADGGKISLMDKVPSRADYMEGGALTDVKIAYLDFRNKRTGKVYAKFSGLVFTSNGVNVDGNSYVKNNVQARALSWEKD